MWADIVVIVIAATTFDRASAIRAIKIGEAAAARDGFKLLISQLDATFLGEP